MEGSFGKVVGAPTGVPGGGVWGRVQQGVVGGGFLWKIRETVFLSPAKKGAVLTKTAKWRIYILPTENKGFTHQTPENDKSDENGGCHSGKGMV